MAKTGVKLTQVPITQDIVDGYLKTMSGEIKALTNDAARRHRDVVRNWSNKNKPNFPTKQEESGDTLTGTVIAREKTKRRRVWLWLNRTGTKPHVIRARRAPALSFLSGAYIPKTRPGSPPGFGGVGGVFGGVRRYAQQVNHPGFPPRKFSEHIKKDMIPLENEAIERRGKQALRKAKRNAKKKKL